MKLSLREFNGVNCPLRRLVQRWLEYPNFRRMGLREAGCDILKIGCGSGYGARLLARQRPHSYEGIDIMPEQIALAQDEAFLYHLEGYLFRVGDATQLTQIQDGSKDLIVIFGVLHHIPEWRKAVQECARILRNDGKLFVEEPDGEALKIWDHHTRRQNGIPPYFLDRPARIKQDGSCAG